MIRFMFRGLPWSDPGSPDRMPIAVRSVPQPRHTPMKVQLLRPGK